MSVGRRLGLLGAALTAVAGCDPAASRDPGEARVQVGDTTIVRVGTPAWSDTASLVEEVAIGVLEGPEEYQFGALLDIAVDADGGVYGEYQDQSLGLAPPGMEPRPPMSWHEPTVYDVFRADGAFLGSVRVPDRTTLSVFRGDTVWGIRRGAFDEPTVVRFRVSVDG